MFDTIKLFGFNRMLLLHNRAARHSFDRMTVSQHTRLRFRRALTAPLALTAATVIVALVFVVYEAYEEASGHTVIRVRSSMQERLSHVGARLFAQQRTRPDILGVSKEKLTELGVLAAGEWEFEEPATFTKVRRFWQSVPDVAELRDELWIALIIERYDGAFGGCNVLYANGKVLYHDVLSFPEVVRNVNLARRELGFPEFAIPQG